MLTIKNLKQKRSSKKLFHKFINLFQIVDKIRTQAYRLFLSIIYRIYNIFYVFLLKPYHNRDCDNASKSFMQVSELIDDNEFWEIEEIINKVKNKKNVWYKIKWTEWGEEYNQWLFDIEFDDVNEFIRVYEMRAVSKRDSSIIVDNSLVFTLSRNKRRRMKKWIKHLNATRN